MFTIDISNHPTFDDITREASMLYLSFEEAKSRIDMDIRIAHYKNDVHFSDLDRTVSLEINNEKQYPTGEIDDNGDPIMIGDYDYFTASAEAGAPLITLVTSGILSVDADGTINEKCKYQTVLDEPVEPPI